ncbi:hypothetical protein BCAR13_410099 [Paraburkholderia caribensis]|nr:hypothetical protein BCAR13_410099 [Paraburkholderia caribensis]
MTERSLTASERSLKGSIGAFLADAQSVGFLSAYRGLMGGLSSKGSKWTSPRHRAPHDKQGVGSGPPIQEASPRAGFTEAHRSRCMTDDTLT